MRERGREQASARARESNRECVCTDLIAHALAFFLSLALANLPLNRPCAHLIEHGGVVLLSKLLSPKER